MTIHNAKDTSFKLIFDEPELFAEFIRNYVPVDILKTITPEDIEDISERFLPLFQDSRDSDTVKRIHLKDKPPLYVIAILEHESEVNYRTCFKMLQYITLVLNDHEKKANKETNNAASAKGFKYPPVLPIVFYDGTDRWTAETNFLDRTELSDVFYKYIPKFEYELVNLNNYGKQELMNLGGALSLILIIDKISNKGDLNSLGKLPPEYLEKLQLEMPPHLNKLLSDVITVLLKRINVPDIEIEEVTERIYGREIKEMFAWADNYDVQATRREAKAEGKAEGIAEGREGAVTEVIKKMKAGGMSIEDIARIMSLTVKEVKKYNDAYPCTNARLL